MVGYDQLLVGLKSFMLNELSLYLYLLIILPNLPLLYLYEVIDRILNEALLVHR